MADQGTYTPINLPTDGEVIDASQVTTDMTGLIDEFNKPVGLSKIDTANIASILPPSGSITMYGALSAPTGWLLCDGSAVSRSVYSVLFGIIGTTYGIGDGASTFNVPNMQGNIAAGYKSGDSNFGTLGGTGGEASHTLSQTELPAHGHGLSSGQFLTNGTGGSNANVSITGAAYQTVGQTANTGGGGAHNNLQPFVVTTYIIKT